MGVLPLRRRAGARVYQLLCLGPQGHATPRFVRRVLACLRSSTHHLQGCSGQPWPGQSSLGGRRQPLERPSQGACLWQYSLGSVPQHTIAVSVSWLARRHRTHFVGCEPRQKRMGVDGRLLGCVPQNRGQVSADWLLDKETSRRCSPQAMASGTRT